MKAIHLFLILSLILMSSCTMKTEQNPLLETENTPFGIPPFESIQADHFIPAFEKGIAEQKDEVDAIINNAEAPTFENTILALEYSGNLLDRTGSVFGNSMSANTNEQLQAIAKEIYPRLSKHEDEILLNENLFDKVKAVYNQKDMLELNAEQQKLLEETYKAFVRNGANLPPEKKEEMKKINEELSLLSLQFGENILAEINKYKMLIDNPADLAGLPESVISAAAEAAGEEGKWVFTLHKPSWIPFLQYADNRLLREKLYKAVYHQGNNNNEYDNKEIIKKMVALRTQKANIMGYNNHAEYELEDRMAKVPAHVYDLLYKLWEPALRNAKTEAAEMQAMIDREGGNFKLESWDWWYYAEKIRKEKYDLDEGQLRPYFELNSVREGAFLLANKLYGITFEKLENVPLPHPDAQAFEVKEADGTHIGVYFADYFPRESKRGGAWMSSYRKQSRDRDNNNIAPIITNVCNFSKPTGDLPALLSYEEVTTLFHEFGHGLHGLLSDCSYRSLSGTSVARDFVELPSQIMENWCPEPEMLKLFARHYKTGEVIPQELIDKLVAAGKFNQGFETVEYLAASILDMDYHTLTNAENLDVETFEKASMDRIGLINEIIPRYKSTYFSHIFSGGYSAGYYSYIWAEVLDADAYQAFVESGDIFNREVAQSFRDNIISRGGTQEPMELYLKFRGKEASIEPLLEKRGLN